MSQYGTKKVAAESLIAQTSSQYETKTQKSKNSLWKWNLKSNMLPKSQNILQNLVRLSL
jgi:hypothetical protein